MNRDVTLALAGWLRTHEGVISGDQASRLGVSDSAIRRLVASGRLVRAIDGVFVDEATAPGHRTALAVAMVGAGPGAIVSHHSAAWLWGILDRAPTSPTITVPRAKRFRAPGIVVHQTARPQGPVRRSGFVTTDPCRTLSDLAPCTPPSGLDDLVDRALGLRLVTVPRLERATRPDPAVRRAGVAVLRRRLAVRGLVGAPHPSVLESRMGRLLRRLEAEEGVPVPPAEVAWARGRYRLDYAWPALRLGLEVDGYVWHATAAQMDYDLGRRNRLAAAGWALLIYTWQQVVHDPGMVMTQIASTYRGRATRRS